MKINIAYQMTKVFCINIQHIYMYDFPFDILSRLLSIFHLT